MIKGIQKKPPVTREAILDKITEYDIFSYYMPNKNWKINRPTYSPFRNEYNPSFVIGNKYGHLTYIDFADTSKKGDCFTFVQQLYNLTSLSEAYALIDKNFGLGLGTDINIGKYKRIVANNVPPKELLEKKYSIIQVITKPFNSRELAYWNQYHQSVQDLKECNVYSIKTVYLNKKKIPLPGELIFGYLYDDRWKIYRPLNSRDTKWYPNNVPITAMDGKEDIKNCETALITKSKKDYMVMRKIFPASCAVQNEGIACFSEENMRYIKDNSKFQILSFDSDETGVKNSQVITKQFGFGYINVPRKYLIEGIKDWADMSKVYGMEEVENYFKQRKLL